MIMNITFIELSDIKGLYLELKKQVLHMVEQVDVRRMVYKKYFLRSPSSNIVGSIYHQ